MRAVLVGAQCATYIGLAWILFTQGNWRLGVAQLLLLVVTALVYS